MYHMEVDTHVHSVASVHAYSTIEECALHARSGGLRGFAITCLLYTSDAADD